MGKHISEGSDTIYPHIIFYEIQGTNPTCYYRSWHFFFLTILLPVCCRPALAGKLFQGWALVRVWAVWSWVAPLAGNTNTPARSLVHSLRLGTSIWSGGRQPTGSSDCRSSSLLLARVSHLRPLHFFPLGDGMRIGREKEREKKQPPPQKRKTRQDTTACETKKKKLPNSSEKSQGSE